MNKEISIGMYVRTDMGIGKVICGEEIDFKKLGKSPIRYRKIIKASFEKTDLIKKGDIISVRIHGDISRHEVNQFDLKGEIIGVGIQILDDIRIFELKELDIVSVLTHEQIKANEYVFEEVE